jgi:hypothetical protein
MRTNHNHPSRSGRALDNKLFEGFQNAVDIEQIVGGGRVAGAGRVLLTIKNYKPPQLTNNVAAIDRQIGMAECLTNQHGCQTLSSRVAVGVEGTLVFLKGKKRLFGFTRTTGNHTIDSAIEKHIIDCGRDIALTKVVESRRREINQSEQRPDKMRIKFVFVPVVNIELKAGLKSEEYLPFKLGYISRSCYPFAKGGQGAYSLRSEGFVKVLKCASSQGSFLIDHDRRFLISPQRYPFRFGAAIPFTAKQLPL